MTEKTPPPCKAPAPRDRGSRLMPALAAALLALGAGGTCVPAHAAETISTLAVRGVGAAPNARVTLSLPDLPPLAAKATQSGTFSFTPIPYDFSSPLTLKFAIPVSDDGKTVLKPNVFALTVSPLAFNVSAEGYASKAASIALNVGGEAAAAGVANNNSFFRIESPAKVGVISPTDTKIVASIINAKESCCPRTITPTEPVMVYLENVPVMAAAAPPAAIRPPVAPTLAPAILPTSTPASPETKPAEQTAPEKKLPKGLLKPGTGVSPLYPKGRPDPAASDAEKSGELTVNEITQVVSIEAAPLAYASWTPSISWAQGLRNVTDHLMQAITLQARMIGGFIDAQAHMDATRTLQRLSAQALKDYTPSEAMCEFGTLSRSVSASETRGILTKKALTEVLTDRDTIRTGTAYAESAGSGLNARTRQFIDTYCDKTDEGDALEKICGSAVVNSDFNRDVDYTRTLDSPLTLDINFATAPTAAQKKGNAEVIALMSNLMANEPFKGFNQSDFKAGKTMSDDVQDYRSVVAARSIARNSFTTLIGLKAEGSPASGQYMRAVLEEMGLSAADAKRLLGTNPSYFAQMEVLTKKIYQDPHFFADLYDKPTNVERQRAAMRAINLQQQNDVLGVLQRREMLLSTLLELKLRNP